MMNFVLLHVNPHDPNAKTRFVYHSRPFQIFGFDIMLDDNVKPWLLEINVGPSMDSYNCKNQMACTHKDCSISPVDSYVKKQVMFDAITLMLHAREIGGVHLMD